MRACNWNGENGARERVNMEPVCASAYVMIVGYFAGSKPNRRDFSKLLPTSVYPDVKSVYRRDYVHLTVIRFRDLLHLQIVHGYCRRQPQLSSTSLPCSMVDRCLYINRAFLSKAYNFKAVDV